MVVAAVDPVEVSEAAVDDQRPAGVVEAVVVTLVLEVGALSAVDRILGAFPPRAVHRVAAAHLTRAEGVSQSVCDESL